MGFCYSFKCIHFTDKIVATNSSVGDVIAQTNKKNDPCNIKGLLPENVAETFEELRARTVQYFVQIYV